MALKRVACPKCRGVLEIDWSPELEAVQCGHCEAVLRLQRPPAAPPPVREPEPAPASAADDDREVDGPQESPAPSAEEDSDEVEEPEEAPASYGVAGHVPQSEEPEDDAAPEDAPRKPKKKRSKKKAPEPPAWKKPAVVGGGIAATLALAGGLFLALRGGGEKAGPPGNANQPALAGGAPAAALPPGAARFVLDKPSDGSPPAVAPPGEPKVAAPALGELAFAEPPKPEIIVPQPQTPGVRNWAKDVGAALREPKAVAARAELFGKIEIAGPGPGAERWAQATAGLKLATEARAGSFPIVPATRGGPYILMSPQPTPKEPPAAKTPAGPVGKAPKLTKAEEDRQRRREESKRQQEEKRKQAEERKKKAAKPDDGKKPAAKEVASTTDPEFETLSPWTLPAVQAPSQLQVFDVADGSVVAKFPEHATGMPTFAHPNYWPMRLSPNGKLAVEIDTFKATANGETGERRAIFLHDGEAENPRVCQALRPAGVVVWLDFVDDRTLAAIAYSAGRWELRRYDLQTGKAAATFPLDEKVMSFENFGSWAKRYREDFSKDPKAPLELFSQLLGARLSSNGKALAIPGKGRIAFVSPADGRVLGAVEGLGEHVACCFDQAGTALGLATDGAFARIDLRTGAAVVAAAPENAVVGLPLVVAPGFDERSLLVSRDDRWALLHGDAPGKELASGPGPVLGMAAPGTYLVSNRAQEHGDTPPVGVVELWKDEQRKGFAEQVAKTGAYLRPEPPPLAKDAAPTPVAAPAAWTPPKFVALPLPDRAKKSGGLPADYASFPDAFLGKRGAYFIPNRGAATSSGPYSNLGVGELIHDAPVKEIPIYRKFFPDDVRPIESKWVIGGGNAPMRLHEHAWAFSTDGSRIARQDPVHAGRMDVFDGDGKPLASVRLTPAAAPIEWSGFVGNDLLLALSAGTLTCCDFAQRTVLWRLAGNYRPGLVRGESGVAALPTADAIDLIDVRQGKLLGRLKLQAPAGGAAELSISPGGAMLAAIRPLQPKPPAPRLPGEVPKPDPAECLVELFDLVAGQRVAAHRLWRTLSLAWVTDEHLLLGGAREVVLLDRRCPVPLGRQANGTTNSYQPLRAEFRQSPDGVIWGVRDITSVGLGPISYLQRHGAILDHKGWETYFDPARKYVSPKGRPVRVEVELDTPERSRELALKLEAELKALGYGIGPGDLALRIVAQRENTKGMTITMQPWGQVVAPTCNVEASFHERDGAVLWRDLKQYYFHPIDTKYKAPHQEWLPDGSRNMGTTFFKFPGPPAELIYAEECEHAVQRFKLDQGFPTDALALAAGKAATVPVQEDFRAPKPPEAK